MLVRESRQPPFNLQLVNRRFLLQWNLSIRTRHTLLHRWASNGFFC